MKAKFVKNKTQFNIRLNKDEFLMVKILKEKYSLNISQCFKNFLKEKLKKNEKEM